MVHGAIRRNLSVPFIWVSIINFSQGEKVRKENRTQHYYYTNNTTIKCIRWSMVQRRVEQFFIYSNQCILFSSTARLLELGGCGVGPVWHLVLYNWFIPNHEGN